MRSYKADLSRRLGPVFAEQAAKAQITSTRNLPAHEEVCLTPEQALKFYGVLSGASPQTGRVSAAMPAIAAAYKPTHGGYPSAGARA